MTHGTQLARADLRAALAKNASLDQLERVYVRMVLDAVDWHCGRAAERLGRSKRWVEYWVKANRGLPAEAPESTVRVVLTPDDQERVDSIVEALRVRGTHTKHGELMDGAGVVTLAVLIVSRMTIEEIARLVDNVPIGPLGVWAASPPPRAPRPEGGL